MQKESQLEESSQCLLCEGGLLCEATLLGTFTNISLKKTKNQKSRIPMCTKKTISRKKDYPSITYYSQIKLN